MEITHIQYADDTSLMGEANWQNIWAFKAILQLSVVSSGLKVNFHKSCLVGFNVENGWLSTAANALNCNLGVFHLNILAFLLEPTQEELHLVSSSGEGEEEAFILE